ncbi:Aprataxin and PNK-like factor [Ooceraea biroi]|uniref:Aprataxin and PNK-like factor n=1 Tax=Ooceraea biroi TaxID=2015173 RepID=A0A026WVA1_OOCBI|nr:Aprataxin and PNK-like factor [Ooceraea biroi]
MKSIGCARWQALKLGTSVPIRPGDVCSLLPEKCWFKIMSAPDTMDESEQRLKRKADEDLNNETDSKKTCLSCSMETVASPSETLNNILNNKDPASEHQDSPVSRDAELNDTNAPILQEIYSASSPEGDNAPATCSKEPSDSQNVTEPSVVGESNGKRKAESADSTDLKETATVEPPKKLKWDCAAHFSDRSEAPSSHREGEPQLTSGARRQDQASVPNAERVPREKCTYGGRCYRRNPNHKKNCSHPGDPDYDEPDDREECPYGVKCYRKNPQHRAQFKHSSVPRRRRRAATPVSPVPVDNAFESDASSLEESVDESDYEPSSMYSDSSEKSEWDDSGSEWEDGTTG